MKSSSVLLDRLTLINVQALKNPIPIFIIGMPRSGTSLVEQILSSHSKIYGTGELDFLMQLAENIKLGRQKIDNQFILDVRNNYFKKLKIFNINKPYFTDKAPLNFLHVALIKKCFPEAKIIYVSRSPEATCWSNFTHFFPSKALSYSNELEDLVCFFNLHVDLMSFWGKKYNDAFYTINYEKLTENPKYEVEKMLNYISVSFEAQCVDFHLNDRVVNTASQLQVREKLYKNSSLKWKQFEVFIGNKFDQLIS
jgi:hypothetical protein